MSAPRRARASLCAALCALAIATPAGATGFHEVGQDILPRERTEVEVSGYLRTRMEALHNLDLDRGLTPSGQPLFPVSEADPQAQTLTHADMRARADIKLYAPGSMVAVKARIDALDNLTLGSLPDGVPSAVTTQRSPADAIRVRRAYGELLLPIGLLAAGRMGTHWGLGMLANGGDCLDCDSSDASDRVAFLTPLAGHIFAAAYDFSATGPTVPRTLQARAIAVEPTTAVRTVTFAAMRYRDEEARARRSAAGKVTVEYGSYVTHRWQTDDVPSSYLPLAQPLDAARPSAQGIMSRGFTATGVDGWARFTFPGGRVEAELAYLVANVDQASLLPGVLLRDPAKSRQLGAALESDFGSELSRFGAGLDFGYASGDPAPGFGVVQKPNAAAPQRGDLDGPQASPRRDMRVDNFRFHPDYRIDRILFREILGAVTDAVYARPHARAVITRAASGSLVAHTAVIASTAVEAASTPGGKAPLGVEIDPSLRYETQAFLASLDYGVLFPLAGLDNVASGLSARPAQLIRLRLNYLF
ncbi:MAG: TIGR04551 family protein [Myxococcales bacterium]|nr:TIGR04551 family protein [Myxococcales bacterium]